MIALTTPARGGYVVPITLECALAEELGDLYGTDRLELNGFTYVLYEESEEINDLKYVLWDRIYKRNDGKYFLQNCSKSGSYWSEYEFWYGEELYEVERRQVVKLEWMQV